MATIDDITEEILNGTFVPHTFECPLDTIQEDDNGQDSIDPDECQPDLDECQPDQDNGDDEDEVLQQDLVYYPPIENTDILEELEVDSQYGFRGEFSERHYQYATLSESDLDYIRENKRVREFLKRVPPNIPVTHKMLVSLK